MDQSIASELNRFHDRIFVRRIGWKQQVIKFYILQSVLIHIELLRKYTVSWL